MIKNCETTAAMAGLPELQEVLDKPQEICAVQQVRDALQIAHMAACGKGTFCRDGILQLRTILDDIIANKGTREDLALLSDLCEVVTIAGDCQMAVAAADFLKTSMDTHGDEWAAHLVRRRCPAKACAAFPIAAPVAPPAGGMRRRRRGE